MKFVGFNFTKISIERLTDSLKDVKINSKIELRSIESADSSFFKDEGLVSVSFSYLINYDPEVAKIVLDGNVLVATDKKTAKNILNEWKDKKIPEEFKITLFNLILRKSNLKAMELEDQMNLPFHIPFPSLKKQE